LVHNKILSNPTTKIKGMPYVPSTRIKSSSSAQPKKPKEKEKEVGKATKNFLNIWESFWLTQATLP
jgi:hypothetical protein